MKFCAIIVGAVYATTAAGWKINWHYTNGQHIESHGSSTSSGCIDLKIDDVKLKDYDVEFDTLSIFVKDPNRVRLWTKKGCGTDKESTWDSGKEGKNDLVPDRIVKSYKIDHD